MDGHIARTARDDDREGDLIDLRRLTGQVLEKIWVLILSVVVTVVVAFVYLQKVSPVYEAIAMVEVPQQARKVVEIQSMDNYDFDGDEALKTIESSLQRTSLFQRVAAREDVKEHLNGFEPRLRDSENSVELALLLKEQTDISLLKGTRLIALTVESTNPALAKSLVNGLVDEFIKEKAEERSGTSQGDFAFFLKEAERLGKKLKQTESTFQNFLPYEDALGINENLKEESEELAKLLQRYGESHPLVTQKRGQINGLLNQLESELEKVIGKIVIDDVELPKLKKDVANEEREKQIEEVMKVLAARYQIASRDVEIDRELHETIVGRMEEATVTKDLDTAILKFVEPAFLPLNPTKPKKIQVLAAAIVLGGGSGLFLIWLMIIGKGGLSTVDEVESKLQKPVLGAIPMDHRIIDSKKFGLSSRKQLTDLKRTYSESGSEGLKALKAAASQSTKISPLVLLSDPGSTVAESFRGLRAALTMHAKNSQERGETRALTALVTSALPAEGKTFVASNLAIAFAAQDGLRTLLVDLDLRLPATDRFFCPEVTAAEGSVSLLRNPETDLASAITNSGIKGLDLLLTGALASNPAELLASGGVRRLLSSVRKQYDRIVIDTAPVNPVADTLLLASEEIDSAILVTLAGKTPVNAVAKAKNLMENAGLPLAGIVLNGLPKKSGNFANPYFYYYHQSGSNYGENYGTSY